jgi:hypothetical protein
MHTAEIPSSARVGPKKMAVPRLVTLESSTQHSKKPVLAYDVPARARLRERTAPFQPVQRVSGVLQGLPDSSAQRMSYAMGPSTC